VYRSLGRGITCHDFSICSAVRRELGQGKSPERESLWNTRDPERVALAYTEDSEWRNRTEFLKGREEIKRFLRRKWDKEVPIAESDRRIC
jgi:nuclear transport factor 2 (NTF2) superfamily protein